MLESAIEREFKPGRVAVSRVQEASEQTAGEHTVERTETLLQPNLPNPIQIEPALRAIIEGVESEIGERFFPSLAKHLAAALDVAYAFVSELNEDRTSFRTLAAWGRGAFLPNFEASLRGTPCEAVLSGQMLHCPRDLQSLFPNDTPLVGWRAESYCGVPLFDSSGQVVGHLAVLDEKPMPDGNRCLSIMRIFAARAWAEIERTRLQTAVRQREKAYRDLYEQAPVAYFSVGTDGRIKKANQRAAELFGYEVRELRGRPIFDLYADVPDGKPKAYEVFRRSLAGEETRAEELQCHSSDGRQVWISLTVKPIRDGREQVEAALATLVDITDRKRAEVALRDNEARLSRILASAMDAIVTIDQERRVVLFNAAAETIFRCSAAEVIGCPFGRFLSEGLRGALASYIGSFSKPASAQRFLSREDLKAVRADGDEFPVEASISQVQVSDRNLFTLIMRDISERKRGEAELRKLHLSNVYLQEEIQKEHNFKEIVGNSPGLLEVLRKVEQVARTDSTVLIHGETGTGKELIARAIHDRSNRKEGPLIRVNCSAISAGLVESELFGHVKGAFTSAIERRIGRFEMADGGTIFLDEVGELPLETQVKLLRVLQEQEFEPVGSSRSLRVDIRVIAATNRDLDEAIEAGRFRSDLFYRLNVFPIQLPPLRDRRADIPKLVMLFLKRLSKRFGRKIDTVSQATMDLLVDYSWPGNIRELQNIIERAVVLSHGSVLELNADLLPPEVSAATSKAVQSTGEHTANFGAIRSHDTLLPDVRSSGSLKEVERSHIVLALQKTGGLIEGPKGAARILEVNPSTLRGRMKKLGIKRNQRPPNIVAFPPKIAVPAK